MCVCVKQRNKEITHTHTYARYFPLAPFLPSTHTHFDPNSSAWFMNIAAGGKQGLAIFLCFSLTAPPFPVLSPLDLSCPALSCPAPNLPSLSTLCLASLPFSYLVTLCSAPSPSAAPHIPFCPVSRLPPHPTYPVLVSGPMKRVPVLNYNCTYSPLPISRLVV